MRVLVIQVSDWIEKGPHHSHHLMERLSERGHEVRMIDSKMPFEEHDTSISLIPNFFYWAMNNKPLPITGDGSETRDWTYVGDIISGLLGMGIKTEAIGESINLGSGSEHQVAEMAELVNKLAGNDAGIIYQERRSWDVKCRLLSSVEKAKRLLGYQPGTSFEDGLTNTYHWFENKWDHIKGSADF